MENTNGNTNLFALSVVKDSVDKNQNSGENKWNASPVSGMFYSSFDLRTSLYFSFSETYGDNKY